MISISTENGEISFREQSDLDLQTGYEKQL